jgi:3-methylfumaryl-CoA hydratase
MSDDKAVNIEDWIGRRTSVTDANSPVQVRQMAAAMDDADRLARPASAPLPAGWHWMYFNPIEVESRLGPDGHPRRGDFLPPVELPRRMWAGSRLIWAAQFVVGSKVDKASRILAVSRKSGRSGDMVFVTVEHVYTDERGLVLTEEHDIVYRDMPGDAERASLQELGEKVQAGEHRFEQPASNPREIHADAVMLFRYSAATFNGHRIHYDRTYAREVEGYPGLVVHGPLIATMLLNYVENAFSGGRPVKTFEFRAKKPTFDIASFHLHAQAAGEGGFQVWSSNNVGDTGIEGRIQLG